MWAVVLSTLPSVVVIKTFVAKMLTTWQMIPARRVPIFSTPEERSWQSHPFKTIFVYKNSDWAKIWLRQMRETCYLSDALAKQTGYVAEHPAFSHFLYFFSDWSSSSSVSVAFRLLWRRERVEKVVTELNLNLFTEHFKLGMHRPDKLDQYPQRYW